MEQLADQINTYYEDTAWDYKYLWSTSALAVHFGYYDRAASNHGDAVIRMNEILAQKVGIKEGDKVLDAGCGVGGSSIWLVKNKRCSVAGINIAESQISEARKNTKKAGVSDKIDFIIADYGNLPLDDNSQDIFWALESLVHSADKKQVIKEAYRVLGKNGRIVFAEYFLRENPSLDKNEHRYLQPWLDGWSMPDLLTPIEYKDYLTEAGFKNINDYDISNNVSLSLRRLKWLCSMLITGARFMQMIGVFTKQRVTNMEASIRQVSAFDRGLWTYRIITAEK